jgi:hypothetical protein
VGIAVFETVITSSPDPMSSAFNARNKASVPLFTPTPKATPQIFREALLEGLHARPEDEAGPKRNTLSTPASRSSRSASYSFR